MNINQYTCNMDVLAGLFLANDTSLDVFLYQGGTSDLWEDINHIKFLDHTNPPIYLELRIYMKNGHIDLDIMKIVEPDPTIYMHTKMYNLHTRTYAVDTDLRVFLR